MTHPPSRERPFPREIGALASVFSFLDAFAEEAGLQQSDFFPISLSVEELFTNMVKYNASGQANIEIGLALVGDAVEVRLTDPDAEPFDPSVYRAEAAAERVKNGKPGGLGLHLVQKLMDEIQYNHSGGRTEIRLLKQMPTNV